MIESRGDKEMQPYTKQLTFLPSDDLIQERPSHPGFATRDTTQAGREAAPGNRSERAESDGESRLRDLAPLTLSAKSTLDFLL